MQKLFEKLIPGSKRKWPVGLIAAALVVSVSTAVSVSAAPNPSRTTANKQSKSVPSMAKLKASVLDMPLAFELNRGQTDAKVKYLTRAQNFTVFLESGETVLRGRNADVLRIKLQNANQSPKVEGENRQLKVSNYYIGNDRSKWIQGVPNFGQVRYRNVYSGIDMVYHSDQRQLEYDFVVNPGADPNQIRVLFEGAEKISITDQGELQMKSAAGNTINHKPVVYQIVDGHRKLIDGEYTLVSNVVSFQIGQYDRTQPLVIDPTLQMLSFFGGTLNDEASGIATSAVPSGAGVVFVGRTESATLPGASSGKTNGINWDAFATGLNSGTPGVPDSGGTTVLWTTYIGGTGDDAARAVAMDNQGNVYVAGYTNSSNFPGGTAVDYDAFIAKLSAATGSMGTPVLYGGPGVDQATSIALDYSTFSNLSNATSILNPSTDPQVTPNVVIGGATTGAIGLPGSPAATIGKTPDGNQKNFNTCTQGGGTGPGCGNLDGFVAIFDSTLVLKHATYIGGGGNDQVNGVAVDIWGNIYATGFATPNVPSTDRSGFPVTRGIATGTLRSGFDASLVPQNAATAFVVKYDCRTGSPSIGVPSPPPQIPACGGSNTLGSLANSALFGGSALGSVFINPAQMVLAGALNLSARPVADAGLAIAVDQNGWGQQGVAGVAPSGFVNAAGFPDLVPFPEVVDSAQGAGTNAGGFQPGLSGPHVYIAGTTTSRDFANSLVVNASCTVPPVTIGNSPPAAPSTVPALCPVPEVWGGAITAAGALPTPRCDSGAAPMGYGNACPTGLPAGTIQDIRIKTVGPGPASMSGQTQGWVAAFQFPAVTQAVVTPPAGGGVTPSTTTVTTLNPPTIPNYLVLQPATCPPKTFGGTDLFPTCVEGGTNAGIFTAASPAPPANLGCAGDSISPSGVACPNTFMGGWSALAVDSDQQVYVIGQIGMSGVATPEGIGGPTVFGAGAPNRLALEIERITPYANTGPFPNSVGGSSFTMDLCQGTANAPCAFPEMLWPNPPGFGLPAPVTSSFIIDTAAGATGTGNFGQILPGSPPSPNPNQPGGLGNGIAVSSLREAFFVGTSTVMAPAGGPTPTAPAAPTATATLNGAGSVLNIIVATNNCGGGTVDCGYTSLPTCTITGGAGTGATCSLAAGGFTLTTDGTGNLVAPGGGAFPFTCSACITAGGTGYTAVPTVTLSSPPVPPSPTGTVLSSLAITGIEASVAPTPASCTPGAPTKCATLAGGAANASKAPATEDVIYGALQFYDAIATPSTAINFTATVNDPTSIKAPNGSSGSSAKAFINYINWEGQALTLPPGCVISPFVPNGQGGAPAFIVTPVFGPNIGAFQVQVNPAAVNIPGVVTSVVTFFKTQSCTGVGQPPLDAWDPVTLTLTVSAPLNVVPENTFVLTEAFGSGVIQPFTSQGVQTVPNQGFTTFVDVSTANAGGPINVTAQIVAGANWAGQITNVVTIPNPSDTLYSVSGPNNPLGLRRIPVNINAQQLAGVPPGTYTAFILIAASPETPALPTSGSTACGTATLPIASGTTSPTCIPIIITVTPTQIANLPAPIVFGASTTPMQTGLVISNPLGAGGTFNFTTGYQPIPVVGTALPAANVFFVGTGTTLIPATVGNVVTGSIIAGGTFTVPVQVNPVGLPTGVYSGQLLVSGNGQASGATPQTTVPLIVFVGPATGNGLGLELPVNLPPMGLGTIASVGSAPGTAGSYPLILSVPSGTSPTGANGIPNPTLIQVTGLNNTNQTPFVVNAPSVSSGLPGVSITNPGGAFGSSPSTCNFTAANQTGVPGSPLGPACAWSIWVDATALNSSNTQHLAACAVPGLPGDDFGITGTLTFTASGAGVSFSNFVVPLTVCVTDFPRLTIAMPTLFPNPTFGTGLSGFPTNIVPGFTQSVVEMALPVDAAGRPVVNLQATAGNSTVVCKVLDIHTNGGIVPNVTFAPLTSQVVSILAPPAPFIGVVGAFTNPFSVTPLTPFNSFFGLNVIGANPLFSVGPFTANPGIMTFQVCANTDPLGNAAGTFNNIISINGAGVGPINLSVNLNVVNPGGGSTGAGDHIGVFRPSTGQFIIDTNGNGTFDAGDTIANFGASGDQPVVGSWGTGGKASEIGIFRSSGFVLNQESSNQLTGGYNFSQASADGKIRLANFGVAGDIPVAGDWNATGVVTIGVFRNGQWILDLNNNGSWDGSFGGDAAYNFGAPGDLPVVGDWNGDGRSKFGVFRPSTGQFILDTQGHKAFDATATVLSFGVSGDIPISINSAKRIGVFRPSTGQWILDTTSPSGTGSWIPSDLVFQFGAAGDLPVVGFF